jgi:hypothetical protein
MERYDNSIRLVVYKDDEEYVCRKEALSVLEKFTEKNTAHIFRGRLQLHKDTGDIHVEVKGAILGTVRLSDFKKRLTRLKTSSSLE